MNTFSSINHKIIALFYLLPIKVVMFNWSVNVLYSTSKSFATAYTNFAHPAFIFSVAVTIWLSLRVSNIIILLWLCSYLVVTLLYNVSHEIIMQFTSVVFTVGL